MSHIRPEANAGLEARLLDALRRCYDPEAGLNVVDLGLIRDISVNGQAVTVRLTPVTTGSRHTAWLVEEVGRRARSVKGVGTVIAEIVSEPRWTTSRMSRAAKERLQLTMGE